MGRIVPLRPGTSRTLVGGKNHELDHKMHTPWIEGLGEEPRILPKIPRPFSPPTLIKDVLAMGLNDKSRSGIVIRRELLYVSCCCLQIIYVVFLIYRNLQNLENISAVEIESTECPRFPASSDLPSSTG